MVTEPAPLLSSALPAGLLWPASWDSKEPTRSLTAFSSTSEKSISSRGSEAPAISDHRLLVFFFFTVRLRVTRHCGNESDVIKREKKEKEIVAACFFFFKSLVSDAKKNAQ